MTEIVEMSTHPDQHPTEPAVTRWEGYPEPGTGVERPLRPTLLSRLVRESGYALSSFPIALVGFVLTVVVLAVGIGLTVVMGGILLVVLAAFVARGFAVVERERMRRLLGRDAPAPAYLRPRPSDGWWRRSLTPLRDPQSWLDIGQTVVGMVTATVAFSVALAWWAATLGGLTYWFWQRYIPFDDADNTTLAEILGLGHGRTPESLLNLALGVVALLTLPLAVRGAAALHAGTASVLLCSRAELQGQVARVAGSRDAARVAEARSLRRLERDIHDGPQQRMVRIAMDLGRARMHLTDDPQRAGEVIDDALRQARETVDELRTLSRGIAPPLLVDRGLAAAVTEIAAGCPVPVEVDVRVPEQLPPHVETTAYFVVAEALTNVAKHSAASSARIAIAMADDVVEVTVSDDGVGGAHPGKGIGLAGLGQRVGAAGGDVAVASPAGGPTAVVARIPVQAESA